MARIVKHRKAQRDVLDIFVYIGERNFDAAERFLSAFDANLRRLAVMPNIGSLRAFGNPTLDGIRSWPISGFENYLIFYRLIQGEVQILRVIHGARDIDRVLEG
ncbi:MAG TPA: type II toxin-antitoxin system RelE/ParE family toxin [Tepidisphaeraceae bacterium]|nr:type II toxin-antitoxin system RelE/ParE family toxin [Tepidisphaeraceae bacterium]